MTASESTAPVGLRARLRSSSMRIKNNCHLFRPLPARSSLASPLALLLPPSCSLPHTFSLSLCSSASVCPFLLRAPSIPPCCYLNVSAPRLLSAFPAHASSCRATCCIIRTDAHCHICYHASLAGFSLTHRSHLYISRISPLITDQSAPPRAPIPLSSTDLRWPAFRSPLLRARRSLPSLHHYTCCHRQAPLGPWTAPGD